MENLPKYYTVLFNAVTDALHLLEKGDVGSAKGMLIWGQQQAEGRVQGGHQGAAHHLVGAHAPAGAGAQGPKRQQDHQNGRKAGGHRKRKFHDTILRRKDFDLPGTARSRQVWTGRKTAGEPKIHKLLFGTARGRPRLLL